MLYKTRYPHPCFAVLSFLLLSALCCALLADSAQAASSRRERRESRQEAPPPPPLTLESFSSSIVLDGRQGAVLSFPLPESVYRGLQRKDFTDICVFDGTGSPVPFSLSNPQAENSRHSLSMVDMNLYPWHTAASEAAMRLPMRTDVEIDASGSIMRIRTQGGEGDTSAQKEETTPKPDAYLLDLKAFLEASAKTQDEQGNVYGPKELRSRTISLTPEGDSPFVCNLSIKTSSDLTAWSSAGKVQALARLGQGDERVERLDITLPDRVERYLLLEIQGNNPGFSSARVEANYSKGVVPVMDTVVYGEKTDNGKSIIYAPRGVFPIVSVDLELPQSEIMSVRLDWRDSLKKDWRFLHSGTVYRIEKDGVVLRGKPFELGRSVGSPNYWRLTAAGDIPFGQAPGLRLLWTRHTLLFLARGQGPWVLAYGRQAAVNTPPLPLADLGSLSPASVLSEAPAATTPQKTGSLLTGQGENKTQWILWAALGVAAIFLSGLAFYMMRSMKNSPAPSDKKDSG